MVRVSNWSVQFYFSVYQSFKYNHVKNISKVQNIRKQINAVLIFPCKQPLAEISNTSSVAGNMYTMFHWSLKVGLVKRLRVIQAKHEIA